METSEKIRMVDCVKCGHNKKYYAKKMCQTCYIGISNEKKKKRKKTIIF